MKVVVALLMAIVCALGGCADQPQEVRTVASPVPPPPDGLEWRPAELGEGGWEGARTSADGRTVVIVLVGGREYEAGDPCSGAYAARAVETADEVQVEILATSPRPDPPQTFVCTMEGHFRSVSVDLAEPLSSRKLVDAQSHKERPVFDGDALAEPGWLPDGWTVVREGPGYPNPKQVSSWQRIFASPAQVPVDGGCEPGEAAVMLTQGGGDLVATYPTNGEKPVRTSDVGGSEATYLEGGYADANRLVWVEGSQGFVLASMPGCAGDTPASEETLLRIA